MSKLLTVFGATGNQGGSIINHVLAHPQLSKEYKLRAITRDATKPAAKALAEKGIDVVSGDMMDRESLRKALSGSDVVFSVTGVFSASINWAPDFKQTEITQGKNVADVCKEVGVKHLIWSTLPNVSKASNGALKNVVHFDAKAEVADYIVELGIPATFFVAGVFMQNFDSAFQKGEDGTYTFAWPNPPDAKNFPCFDAAADTGLFVTPILLNPSNFHHKTIVGATGFFSPNDIVAAFHKVTGKELKYVEVPGEVWKGFLPPSAGQAFLENFYFTRDYKYFGGDADAALSESLAVLEKPPTTLEQYFEKTGPY